MYQESIQRHDLATVTCELGAATAGAAARHAVSDTPAAAPLVYHATVDAIILATGYRPSVPYLHDLGALDRDGAPLHAGGISLTHPGLVYVGLEFQRSYASNTLRGVSADASAVVEPLAAWIRDAPTKVGLEAWQG